MGLTVSMASAIESERKRCWASLYMGFYESGWSPCGFKIHVAATWRNLCLLNHNWMGPIFLLFIFLFFIFHFVPVWLLWECGEKGKFLRKKWKIRVGFCLVRGNVGKIGNLGPKQRIEVGLAKPLFFCIPLLVSI